MYSDVKSVRIVVSLLKKYGIKYAVLSSGTCSIPVLRCLEIDKDFVCYSDIDERSAVFFAIGIAQASREAVAVVCTSGTAACNYLPGVVEAKRLHVPLVVITCDKVPNSYGDKVIQKVNQYKLFGNNCKYFVEPPIIKDKNDERYCEKLVCKALVAMWHHVPGPVHINLYTDGEKKSFQTPTLPSVRKIQLYTYQQLLEKRDAFISYLHTRKRILIVLGEALPFDTNAVKAIERFCEVWPAVISAEHTTNLWVEKKFITYRVTEQINPSIFKNELKPDLVISYGGFYSAYKLYNLLRNSNNHFEHWCIDRGGEVSDIWGNLSKVFESSFEGFFSLMTEGQQFASENEYYKNWKWVMDRISYPDELPFTSLYAARELTKSLSECSILHLGILNSTRLVQMFDIPNGIKVYSNLGALGIDGSLSTFLGQAEAETEGLCICLIGDLSIFYDMNAFVGRKFGDNIRIMLLNNGGGSEFHLNTGLKVIPELDDFIAAGHDNRIEGWAKACGFNYFSASSVDEFTEAFDAFIKSSSATFFEVIVDKEQDAQAIKAVNTSNILVPIKTFDKQNTRKFLVKTIGLKRTQRLVNIAKAILDK